MVEEEQSRSEVGGGGGLMKLGTGGRQTTRGEGWPGRGEAVVGQAQSFFVCAEPRVLRLAGTPRNGSIDLAFAWAQALQRPADQDGGFRLHNKAIVCAPVRFGCPGSRSITRPHE